MFGTVACTNNDVVNTLQQKVDHYELILLTITNSFQKFYSQIIFRRPFRTGKLVRESGRLPTNAEFADIVYVF